MTSTAPLESFAIYLAAVAPPAPPPAPNMHVQVETGLVTLYWQNNSEPFLDPISQQKDFEGYRVYGARKTDNEALNGLATMLNVMAGMNSIDSIVSMWIIYI